MSLYLAKDISTAITVLTRYYIFIVVCVFNTTLHGQNTIDSLKQFITVGDTIGFQALVQLSEIFQRENLDSSIYFGNKALALSQKINDLNGELRSYQVIATTYFANGKYDSSNIYVDRGLEKYRPYLDSLRYYELLSIRANNFRKEGDSNSAIKILQRCIDFFEERGDVRRVASNYNYLGSIFWGFEDIEQARIYWEKALQLYRQIEFDNGISNMLNNLGVVFKMQKNYSRALELYYESLEMDREANNLYGQGLMLNNIGSALNTWGNEIKDKSKHLEALSIYQQAYAINTEIKNNYSLIYSLFGLGETHLYLGDYSKSVEYGLDALELIESSGSIYERYDIHNLLHVAYDSLGKSSKAIIHLRKVMEAQDSIFKIERAHATMELEEKYNLSKKETEIAVLNKEKTIQQLELKSKNNMVLGLTMGLILFVGMGFFLVRLNLMRREAFNQIAKKNEELASRNEEIISQRNQIEIQNRKLEEKNDLILESIRYAQQIQETILPSYSTILTAFEEFFVMYKPKDIVSGDFYWINEKGKLVVASVDCTGHGIPGAFMSMIGNELLNEIVLDKKILKPEKILNELNNGIIRTLKQDIKHNFHGMDIAICVIDKSRRKMHFSGAKQSLLKAVGEEIIEYKGDRFSLGGLIQKNKEFNTSKLDLEHGATYYLMSDGLQHQFGGEDDKKFSLNRIKKIISEYHHEPLSVQRRIFEQEFETWKGENEQIDDVMLLGFKV